jgi:hypothetical protein
MGEPEPVRSHHRRKETQINSKESSSPEINNLGHHEEAATGDYLGEMPSAPLLAVAERLKSPAARCQSQRRRVLRIEAAANGEPYKRSRLRLRTA